MTIEVALVTTTINVPYVLENYRSQLPHPEDLTIIVAGDENTDPSAEAFVKSIGGTYLTPDDQAIWRSSPIIGWQTIQRRNIAILEAIRTGANYIITVDDDNIPLRDYFIGMLWPFASRGTSYHGSDDWYDPCQHLWPPIHHRGYPYSRRHRRQSLTTSGVQHQVGVTAGLWLGDPDIDAIERLVNKPRVVNCNLPGDRALKLAPGTWCPFNSQNTAWDSRYASLMYCWPRVGRFDDIFASYLARRVLDSMDISVAYVPPTVKQERNPHDLMWDLDKERLGYRTTDAVVDVLRRTKPGDGSVTQRQRVLFDAITRANVLPNLSDAFDAWLKDVEEARRG